MDLINRQVVQPNLETLLSIVDTLCGANFALPDALTREQLDAMTRSEVVSYAAELANNAGFWDSVPDRFTTERQSGARFQIAKHILLRQLRSQVRAQS